MNKQFEFKKLDGNKYAFIMKSDDIERTEVVDKEYAKEHYKELQKQKADLFNNLSKVQADLKVNNVQHDEELERFINLANKAAQYKKYMDLSANLNSILIMLDDINISMKNMENVIPEVKRMPK